MKRAIKFTIFLIGLWWVLVFLFRKFLPNVSISVGNTGGGSGSQSNVNPTANSFSSTAVME